MAEFLSDGTIKASDGTVFYADDSVPAKYFPELIKLFNPPKGNWGGFPFARGGSAGVAGSDGAQGSQGPQGPGAGAQGAQGSSGAQGAQGPNSVGAQGAQGATGSGAQGSTGAQGAQGPNSVGAQGAQGATGTGAQGVQGSSGAQGTIGAQGATGSGAQGSQGAQGATGSGAQGAQGEVGAQGATGSGAQGSQGAQGATGSGAQGAQGTVGAQGAAGGSTLTNDYTTATGPTSLTSSVTFTTLLTRTPAAGDYLVWAALWGDGLDATSGEIEIRISSGGVAVTDSTKRSGEAESAEVTMSTIAKVTVNGGQAIEFQAKKAGSANPDAHNMQMSILKVG